MIPVNTCLLRGLRMTQTGNRKTTVRLPGIRDALTPTLLSRPRGQREVPLSERATVARTARKHRRVLRSIPGIESVSDRRARRSLVLAAMILRAKERRRDQKD